MGESKTVSIARLCAAVTTGLAATALLASCSGLGAAPGSTASAAAAGSAAASEPAASAPASASASASADPSTTPSADSTPSAAVVVVTPAAEATDAKKAAVVPFITSAAWDATHGLDVSAIVPRIVEKTGTCTVIAVKGDATVKKSGPAAAAASYTGCQQLAIAPADLAPGTWQIRLSYSSDDSAGTSAARTVTVG